MSPHEHPDKADMQSSVFYSLIHYALPYLLKNNINFALSIKILDISTRIYP
jgi:hypothetical protein